MPRPPHRANLPPVLYFCSPDFPKPDAGAIVRSGLAGHPIELRRPEDYINLFHAMDKMGVVGSHRLMRKRLGPMHWLAYMVPVFEYEVLETASTTQTP